MKKNLITSLIALTVCFTACSDMRYGYISRVKTNPKKNETARVEKKKIEAAPVMQAEITPEEIAAEQTTVVESAIVTPQATSPAVETPAATNTKAKTLRQVRRALNAIQNDLQKEENTSSTTGEQMLSVVKDKKITQENLQQSVEAHSWVWYVLVGLLLVLIGALIGTIVGAILWIVGVIAIIYGLLILLQIA